MKTRILILLIILGLCIGLTTQSAKAGPPWRAIVRTEKDYCYTTMVADDLTTTTFAWMDLHEVYQPHTGIKNDSCHGWVDFSSPDFATIADICAHPEIGWTEFCNGNGNMTWGVSHPNPYVFCTDEYGNTTYNTEGTLTKSGQVSIACHYKLPPVP